MNSVMVTKKFWHYFAGTLCLMFLMDSALLYAADEDIQAVPVIKALPDGSLYSGDLKYEVIREGNGANEWPNGDRYKGQWLNDNPHGKGFLVRKNKEEYHGLFEFGQFSGLGDLKTVSGERYLGHFRFNQPDGLGLLITNNDEYYLGEFSQGKRHGRILYFEGITEKPEYQLWFNDELDKNIDMKDPDNAAEQKLINEMIESISKIGKKRLAQRKSNTHYRARGKVRKIVSNVEDSPGHAYGDLIINLLNLE